MRIRYLPGTDDILDNSKLLVKEPEGYKGHWLEQYPGCSGMAIEIGSGRGRFIRDIAARDPEILYIGIEKFSTVLARAILNNEPEDGTLAPNLALVRRDALELDESFTEGELDRVYLNFSDPWPKDRHAKRRLTSERFLALYRKWLKPEGELHFKTDNDGLFAYSVETLKAEGWEILFQTDRWHQCPEFEGDIQTEYEMQFTAQGKHIHKLTARPIR